MIAFDQMQVIGGHDGLRVYRTEKGILKLVHQDTIEGQNLTDMNIAGIHNEARFLRLLEDTGYTPRLIDEGDDWILEEDLGDTETPTSIQELSRHCCRMLNIFCEQRVRHIDLTWPNVVVRDNHPWAIDWQQSRLWHEEPNPNERWETDTATVWRWLSVVKDTKGVNDENRVVRRWASVLGQLGAQCRIPQNDGKTFLDLGCFQGDHVAMARCDGMEAEGVDFGGFRTGEDSIEIAEKLWAGMGCKFTKVNIMDLPGNYFVRDVVVMFSTWPYVVNRFGPEKAEHLLATILWHCGRFFFETQLYGDGPGPDFLRKKNDVADLLRRCGATEVTELSTIPVYGRPAERTVWMAKGQNS